MLVIFDMDGVLMDSEPAYLKRHEEFLKYKGYEISKEFLDRIAGNSRQGMSRLFRELPGFDMEMSDYFNERNEYYKDKEIDFLSLKNPGLYETLERLIRDGHTLALASSSSMPHIQKILDLFGIRDCFQYVISGSDMKESKPDPEIYLKTVRETGFSPDRCIAVEDSELGITSAKRAGLLCIAKRDDRFNYDQSAADYMISELSEIPDIVSNLCR